MVQTLFLVGNTIGILPGWHGMENGQKPEMENKKKEIEMENGPKLDRGKNGKKMAQLREFSIIFHFWAFFCHFCPCPA